ncbi:hypothetical protein GCM10023187_09340 [Nibrella viscosa]|uniref:WYL domain-containing protein n=1 Tax=Nibrella viscosa TaxID=1084524 RepID=A0ABP8K0U5_9BACT
MEHLSEQLNEHFGIEKGIAERQLKGDINIMRSLPPRGFDAPIICRKGVYFYDDPNFSIEKKALNSEDIENLTEAVALLRQFQGLPHFREIDAILTKIEGKTITNDPEEAIISFENTQLTRGYEWFNPIYTAIRQEQPLEIRYRAFLAPEDEVFTMHPYYLKEYRGRWYVFGLVAEKDLIYNLSLDRIVDVTNARCRFKNNRTFNPSTYFKDIVGVTRPNGKPIETVLLRVHTDTAPFLETRPIHSSQIRLPAEGDLVLFQYHIVSNYEFRAEVLRLGAAVEVLEPEWLRGEVANQIQILSAKYNSA